jgi:E3 ubiquitin-protein ligase UBR7
MRFVCFDMSWCWGLMTYSFPPCSDDLKNYLRPFAQEGKVVNEADVRTFFDSLTDAARKGRTNI